MIQQLSPQTSPEIIYPDSDGQPMADNTEQFKWIVLIKENLEIWFAPDLNVFVAGNLLWYPVKGNEKLRQAPDIMVVLGRPKGKRGSYQQWEEENVTPQVVFEVLSPGNRSKQMFGKLLFYQRYGVEEYYIYDPERNELTGFVRSEDWLEPIEKINGWISPLLQIRFELTENNLEIYRPDGRRFLSPVELEQRAEEEHQRAEEAIAQLKKEQQLYQELVAKLRDRGIDPEQL
jgi:Uma2 family endonuclease